ncbi:hypothetical protein JCM10908_004801 [Rhodotorula pacifica]|uniref:uncharacterized protein n=1 Tax=Rhodotorula pacifica TaxID=1495444 RepID=UPI0031749CE3
MGLSSTTTATARPRRATRTSLVDEGSDDSDNIIFEPPTTSATATRRDDKQTCGYQAVQPTSRLRRNGHGLASSSSSSRPSSPALPVTTQSGAGDGFSSSSRPQSRSRNHHHSDNNNQATLSDSMQASRPRPRPRPDRKPKPVPVISSSLPVGVPRPPTKKRKRTSAAETSAGGTTSQKSGRGARGRETTPIELLLRPAIDPPLSSLPLATTASETSTTTNTTVAAATAQSMPQQNTQTTRTGATNKLPPPPPPSPSRPLTPRQPRASESTATTASGSGNGLEENTGRAAKQQQQQLRVGRTISSGLATEQVGQQKGSTTPSPSPSPSPRTRTLPRSALQSREAYDFTSARSLKGGLGSGNDGDCGSSTGVVRNGRKRSAPSVASTAAATSSSSAEKLTVQRPLLPLPLGISSSSAKEAEEPTQRQQLDADLPAARAPAHAHATTAAVLTLPRTKRLRRMKETSSSFAVVSPQATPRASNSDNKPKPRPRRATSPRAAAPPSPTFLAPLLRSTDFPSIDPRSTYGLQSSLLFQIEHLRLGALTYEQGGRRVPGAASTGGIGNGIGAKGLAVAVVCARVPSWARTSDGKEWEQDVIRRLASRLNAPPPPPAVAPLLASASSATSTSSSTAQSAALLDASFVPPVFIRDVHDLDRVRLGKAGGTECYLLGKGKGGGGEFPCKMVVLVGWVVDREYREREGSYVYTIDDGTGIIAVHCAAPSPFTPGTASTSTSTSTSHLSTALAPPRDPQRHAAQLAAERKFSALEERAEKQSEKTVLPVGRAVRVFGAVEEPRNVWETERRVVARRVDLIDDIDQVSAHMLEVARLHREVYDGQRVDVKAKLEALETAEREREQLLLREQEGDCSVASVASSAANSPSRSTRNPIRPLAPAKLPADKITLFGFIMYIKLHVQRHYLQQTASASVDVAAAGAALPPSSPSPFGLSDTSSSDQSTVEVSIPFSLPQLKANKNLSIFATRLAQEQARIKEQTRASRLRQERVKGSLGMVAGTRVDETPTKGQAWVGGNPYLRNNNYGTSTNFAAGETPSSSSASNANRSKRRTRQRCDTVSFWEEAGPLFDDELEEEVGKTWRAAIRTMRSRGMIVEYAEPEVEAASAWRRRDEVQLSGNNSRRTTADLPDLPRHRAGSTRSPAVLNETPRKRKSPEVDNCPWGDVRLEGSDDLEDAAVSTPRASKKSKVVACAAGIEAGPAPGCPWGDVKLFDDDGEDDGHSKTPVRGPSEFSTPRGKPNRSSFSPDDLDYQLPPSAQQPSSPSTAAAAIRVYRSPSSCSNCSDTSMLTTGSLADDNDDDNDGEAPPPPPQRFQLVTAASLSPLIESLVVSIYETNTKLTSVAAEDVRKRMYLDSQWEAVAREGEQVDEALDLLCLEGAIQRHGQGFRPTQRW